MDWIWKSAYLDIWTKDDKCCVGLFDVNCSLFIDLIRVDSYSDYSFLDGRLIVNHEDDNIIDVYSADGQKLYI